MDSNAPGGSYTPPPSPPPTGGGTGSGDLVYPTQPPKDPTIILILNLLVFGGLGYIILGQKVKGIVAIVAAIVIGIPTCGIGTGAVCIFGAIDGMMQAQQLQQGHPIGQWTFFNDHR